VSVSAWIVGAQRQHDSPEAELPDIEMPEMRQDTVFAKSQQLGHVYYQSDKQ